MTGNSTGERFRVFGQTDGEILKSVLVDDSPRGR